MKKIIYLLPAIIGLFCISTTFNSCTKKKNGNDESGSGTGSISYLGKNYMIEKGLFEDYGINDGVYNYQVYLFSDGVNIDNETGYGNVIAIYFYGNTKPIQTGTIPYYEIDADPVPTFEAEVALDYNLDTNTGIRISSFTGGELTITKTSDNNYSIQFNCVTEEQETLSGQYTGTISEF